MSRERRPSSREVPLLGTLLQSMGATTAAAVEAAAVEQLSYGVRIGELLVLRGDITHQQLVAALTAQEGLRSIDPVRSALAQAAVAEHSAGAVLDRAATLRDKVEAAKRESGVHEALAKK